MSDAKEKESRQQSSETQSVTGHQSQSSVPIKTYQQALQSKAIMHSKAKRSAKLKFPRDHEQDMN